MHKPALYFPENKDCKVLEIQDITAYDSLIEIENATIKIEVPGIDCEYFPSFKVKGKSFYTTNTFGLTKADCKEDLEALPDGIYRITYSLCPNETVYQRYRLFRGCITRCKILSKITQYLSIPCDSPNYDCNDKKDSDMLSVLLDLLAILESCYCDAECFKYDVIADKMEYINKKLDKI